MLGLIERLAERPPGVGLVDGGSIVLLDGGPTRQGRPTDSPSLAGSPVGRASVRGHRNGTLPPLDLAGHARLLALVTELVAEGVGGGSGLVAGIHDVSGGGLGVALAEMAVRSGTGLEVAGVDDHHELFTEAPSRVVVCTTDVAARWSPGPPTPGSRFRVLGTAGGDRITIGRLVDLPVAEATAAWRDRLPALLDEFTPAAVD